MRNEIVENMSNEEYHAHEGISNSGMSLLLDCPARYYAKYLDKDAPKEVKRDAFAVGTAFHSIILEPELFWQQNYIMPKVDRRTKAGKEEYENHLKLAGNKNFLDAEEFEQISMMRDSLYKRLPWSEKTFAACKKEQSFFWQDAQLGVQLKSRPDAYNETAFFDLKTTDSVNYRDFQKSIMNYAYYRQAALAREAFKNLLGININYFVNVVIEKKYPYLCAAYMISDAMLEKGHAEIRTACETFKFCTETNQWADYGQEIMMIDLPSWLK